MAGARLECQATRGSFRRRGRASDRMERGSRGLAAPFIRRDHDKKGGVRMTRWSRRRKLVVGGIVVFVLLAIIGSLGNHKKATSSPSAPATADVQQSSGQTSSSASTTIAHKDPPVMSQAEKDARHFIVVNGHAADVVQANVQVAEIALGQFLKHQTAANLEQVAEQSDSAHTNLNDVRDQFVHAATGDLNSPLGQAEVNVWSGANDLKNSMGALTATTGDPTNAAVAAHFTNQFQAAQQEWNTGVRTVWRMAHERGAPTI